MNTALSRPGQGSLSWPMALILSRVQPITTAETTSQGSHPCQGEMARAAPVTGAGGAVL